VEAQQCVELTGTNRPRTWHPLICSRSLCSSGGSRPRELPQAVSVVMAEGKHPVPFRTRKLSPPAPMVLPGKLGGRVGRRRDTNQKRRLRAALLVSPGPYGTRCCGCAACGAAGAGCARERAKRAGATRRSSHRGATAQSTGRAPDGRGPSLGWRRQAPPIHARRFRRSPGRPWSELARSGAGQHRSRSDQARCGRPGRVGKRPLGRRWRQARRSRWSGRRPWDRWRPQDDDDRSGNHGESSKGRRRPSRSPRRDYRSAPGEALRASGRGGFRPRRDR
jgi:hypothetical protein